MDKIKLDPREGEGERIADELSSAYREAYDAFAGPKEFRHSENYFTYNRAGLLGVYKYIMDKHKGE